MVVIARFTILGGIPCELRLRGRQPAGLPPDDDGPQGYHDDQGDSGRENGNMELRNQVDPLQHVGPVSHYGCESQQAAHGNGTQLVEKIGAFCVAFGMGMRMRHGRSSVI